MLRIYPCVVMGRRSLPWLRGGGGASVGSDARRVQGFERDDPTVAERAGGSWGEQGAARENENRPPHCLGQ